MASSKVDPFEAGTHVLEAVLRAVCARLVLNGHPEPLCLDEHGPRVGSAECALDPRLVHHLWDTHAGIVSGGGGRIINGALLFLGRPILI